MTATSTPRYITYVPLDAIRPHPQNPRTHDQPAIIDSIRRHGFTNAVQVCERTQLLVAGHGRWEALVVMFAAGEPMPEGIVVDDDGQWLLPVQRGWSSGSDAELAAYVIKDNELAMLGGYDDRKLSGMVEEILAESPEEFDALPFGDEEMERLLKFSRDGSDVEGGPALMIERTSDDEKKPAEAKPAAAAADEDDDDLGTDMGMTDVPDGPQHERVRCPECGTHFRPGDRF